MAQLVPGSRQDDVICSWSCVASCAHPELIHTAVWAVPLPLVNNTGTAFVSPALHGQPVLDCRCTVKSQDAALLPGGCFCKRCDERNSHDPASAPFIAAPPGLQVLHSDHQEQHHVGRLWQNVWLTRGSSPSINSFMKGFSTFTSPTFPLPSKICAGLPLVPWASPVSATSQHIGRKISVHSFKYTVFLLPAPNRV